jgi:hypothetical protein
MRKEFVVIVLVFCCFISQAQKRVSFGLKGGLNIANQIGNVGFLVPSNDQSRFGVHVGVYSSISLTKKFSLQPEIIYSEQGAKNRTSPDFNVKSSYINLPIVLNYSLTRKLTFGTGPQFGFLLDASSKFMYPNANWYYQNDFSWIMGFSYHLPLDLNFSIRYAFGLSDIINSQEIFRNVNIEPWKININNRVFQFSIGYRIFK